MSPAFLHIAGANEMGIAFCITLFVRVVNFHGSLSCAGTFKAPLGIPGTHGGLMSVMATMTFDYSASCPCSPGLLTVPEYEGLGTCGMKDNGRTHRAVVNGHAAEGSWSRTDGRHVVKGHRYTYPACVPSNGGQLVMTL